MTLALLLTVLAASPAAPTNEPELRANGEIDALASDGTDIFWVAGGHAWTMPTDATEPRILFDLEPSEITRLAADASGVVAIRGSERRHTLLAWSATNRKLVELASGDGEVSALAADAETVYWLVSDPDTLGPGALLAAPRAGGKTRTLADGLRDPWSLALDDTHVYFTTMGSAFSKPLGRPDGAVARVGKTGGRVTVLFAGQFEPDNLVVAGDLLYWSDGKAVRGADARSGLWRGKKTGGKAVRLAGVDDVVTDLDVCATRVVATIPGNPRSEAEAEWPLASRGSVRSVPARGGRLVRITARDFARPMHLAITQQAVWWSDGAGLWRMPRAAACAAPTPPVRPE